VGGGGATALLFAERGASVVVAARNQKGLDAVVAEIERKGGKAIAVVADTADVDQVKAVADAAVREFGRIDTWAHVSGVGLWATVEQTRPEEYERLIEVNLLGQIYGALAALPHLRAEGRGALIHVSSIEAKVSMPFNSAYAASKHGVVGFLDTLRLELAREGLPIAVVNVMPGTIDTPIFANALTRLGVEPRGAAPVYAPELVARSIVKAAERPQRDVLVGGGGALLARLAARMPHLTDQLLLTPLGFESQLTKHRKSPEAPNNLFEPTPDDHLRIHGDLHREEHKTSVYTAVQTSRALHALRDLARPLARAAAMVMERLWATRHGKGLKGMKRRSGMGAGLPAPVVAELEREGLRLQVEHGQGVKLEHGQGVKLEHGQGVKLEHGQEQKLEHEQELKLEHEQELKLRRGRKAKLHKGQKAKLHKGQKAKLHKGQESKLRGRKAKLEKEHRSRAKREESQERTVRRAKGQGVKPIRAKGQRARRRQGQAQSQR
jgi:NAD(P)-dependent dehydrogenase (short-subunit alcohol dehydrogenase family)